MIDSLYLTSCSVLDTLAQYIFAVLVVYNLKACFICELLELTVGKDFIGLANGVEHVKVELHLIWVLHRVMA